MRRALAVQQRITASVNAEDPGQEQFEKALATLWAPLDHPAAARPVLTLWFNEEGWRCPYDVRHAVGSKAPLGQLPVPWRFVTLIALTDVFGADPNEDRAISAGAIRMTRRAAFQRSRIINPHQRRMANEPLLLRSSAEYERLARQILADPGWIAAQHLPERKRGRVRARLIDAALSRPLAPTVWLLSVGDMAGR
jgi:hypothetical protein